MRRARMLVLPLALATMALSATVAAQSTRTIGEAIDDAALVAKVKAKLTADRISNLTKIAVKSDRGHVTLSGTVDSVERRARAVEVARAVNGVKSVVNAIDVVPGGATSPPSAGAAGQPAGEGGTRSVDATGTVARVDPDARTITLEDGRVLKATDRTLVWQPTTIGALRPGTQVLIRDADTVDFRSGPETGTPPWRMGTVNRVDRGASEFVLMDGTIVRVTRATMLRRGSESLTLDRLEPGAEVAVRAAAPSSATAEGSASPRATASAAVIEAAEVRVLWTPAAS